MCESGQVVGVLKGLGLKLVNEQREGLAIKLHYLAYLLHLAQQTTVDAVISKWVWGRREGGGVALLCCRTSI